MSDSERTLDESSPDDEEQPAAVTLGGVVLRLRKAVRDFKRKPNLMDELRRTTAKLEFNGKSLKPKLDCPTRWYSTLLMIHRALRILPAINNVLSRHGTPIDSHDAAALSKIVEVLEPFKRGILLLCKTEATLIQADRVCRLILSELGSCGTPLADVLSEALKEEILERRSTLSSVLEFLHDRNYDFAVETLVGQRRPSEGDMIRCLSTIVQSDSERPQCTASYAQSAVSRFHR